MSNKVKKFFFDIDDTLYNQYEPFRRAFEYSFGDRFKALNVERIFIDSRARSDEVFDMVSRGDIDKEEMYAYRIGTAFEDNGAHLSKSLRDLSRENLPFRTDTKFVDLSIKAGRVLEHHLQRARTASVV